MYEKEKAEIATKEALVLSNELEDFVKFVHSKVNDPQWLSKFATVDQTSQTKLLHASLNLVISWAAGVRYLLLYLNNDTQHKEIIEVVNDYLSKIILEGKSEIEDKNLFNFIE